MVYRRDLFTYYPKNGFENVMYILQPSDRPPAGGSLPSLPLYVLVYLYRSNICCVIVLAILLLSCFFSFLPLFLLLFASVLAVPCLTVVSSLAVVIVLRCAVRCLPFILLLLEVLYGYYMGCGAMLVCGAICLYTSPTVNRDL